MASVYFKLIRGTSNVTDRNVCRIAYSISGGNLFTQCNDVRRLMSTNIDVFAPQKQSELSRLHMRVTELEENVAKLTALVDKLILYAPRKIYHLET